MKTVELHDAACGLWPHETNTRLWRPSLTNYRPRPITMRRAQTVRSYTNGAHSRPSLQLGADDMGTLTEGDERPEDGLRKKLLDKDRENDKVCITFGILSALFFEIWV